jgi:hypothetical protein
MGFGKTRGLVTNDSINFIFFPFLFFVMQCFQRKRLILTGGARTDCSDDSGSTKQRFTARPAKLVCAAWMAAAPAPNGYAGRGADGQTCFAGG